MRIQTCSRPSAAGFPVAASRMKRAALVLSALLLLASCVSSGSVRSGQSAEYSTGLSVTLVAWRDAADLGPDRPAEGRWLTASVRVDYDGNAQFAEIPLSAFRVTWSAADGSQGRSAPLWAYDPTPGVGWSSGRESLRVRVSNRFTLAFDVPAECSPYSFEAGEASFPLNPPETP